MVVLTPIEREIFQVFFFFYIYITGAQYVHLW